MGLGPGRGLRGRPRQGARRTRTTSPGDEDLTSFPAIRQDLAFWFPADRTAAELVEVVRGAGGKLLRDVGVFDVYAREGQDLLGRAAGVPRSDRTLTDEEIAPQRKKTWEAVKSKLEGELRG